MFKSAWDSKQDAVYSTNLQLTKVSVPLVSILFLIQERKESETSPFFVSNSFKTI